MTAPSHQALYRSSPLVFGGLLGAIVLAVAGGAAGLQIVPRDQRLALVVGMLGLFLVVFTACALAALRRHRWTIDADALVIEECPLVPMTGRRRARRVPFDQIAALSNAPNGADEVLALTTRDGERFVLPPARLPVDGGTDQKGLAAFAAGLQTAMKAEGIAPPPVTDGLGFWNRTPGLALLGIALVASTGVAAVVLWGLWQGAVSRVKTHEAAAAVVVLPIVLGLTLRRCWSRRRSVPQAMAETDR